MHQIRKIKIKNQQTSLLVREYLVLIFIGDGDHNELLVKQELIFEEVWIEKILSTGEGNFF